MVVLIIVTPFVGVWIETSAAQMIAQQMDVTPFVGVWIETFGQCQRNWGLGRHTLRGCVD